MAEKFYQFTVRFPDPLYELIVKLTGDRTKSATIIEMIEECIMYREILASAKIEIEQIFSDAETTFIADAMNGICVQGGLRFKQYILHKEISDAITLLRLDAKWGVDKETILSKITNLTNFQTAAVYAIVEERLGK